MLVYPRAWNRQRQTHTRACLPPLYGFITVANQVSGISCLRFTIPYSISQHNELHFCKPWFFCYMFSSVTQINLGTCNSPCWYADIESCKLVELCKHTCLCRSQNSPANCLECILYAVGKQPGKQRSASRYYPRFRGIAIIDH